MFNQFLIALILYQLFEKEELNNPVPSGYQFLGHQTNHTSFPTCAIFDLDVVKKPKLRSASPVIDDLTKRQFVNLGLKCDNPDALL